MKNSLLTIITLTLISFWACNQAEPVCPDTQTFDFKLLLNKKGDSTSTRIKVYINNTDSLSTGAKFPELVNIPVNLNNDSTVFYIDFINDTAPEFNKTDSMWFHHTDSLYLNNQECGFITEFYVDTTAGYGWTINEIDSVYYINKRIDADNNGNFKIYY